MLEKRRAIRFHLGVQTDVAFLRGDNQLVAPLLDISSGGLMVQMPEKDSRLLVPGGEIAGQLKQEGKIISWRGRIVHQSPGRRGMSVGVAFSDSPDVYPSVSAAVSELVQQPDAGGIHLKAGPNGIVLEVVGRLSFSTSRESLVFARMESIAEIDLSRCRSVDSAGLGTLAIARDRRIPIVGAQGTVRQLLTITGILKEDAPSARREQVLQFR